MSNTTHAAPSFKNVFISHLRSAGAWSDPRMAATWILIMPLLLVIFSETRGFMLSPLSLVAFATILGVIFPAQLWWVMPSADSRSYFFAAPVGRVTNALARVFSGWVFCMAICGGFLLSMFVIRQLLGDRIWDTAILSRLYGAASLPSWMWLVPLGAATLGYLYSSMAQVGSRTPQIWMFPILLVGVGAPTFGLMLERGGLPVLTEILGRGSPFGLARALMGQMQTASEAGVVIVSDLRAWLVALTFWLGLGVVGLLVLASRYREW